MFDPQKYLEDWYRQVTFLGCLIHRHTKQYEPLYVDVQKRKCTGQQEPDLLGEHSTDRQTKAKLPQAAEEETR